ncbi:hypothetical protein [Aquipuribacter nitratireducens]|uniref:Uncharacterized protein n=1 Tax=Aquipuribacter nitratireducens TaxID=650104 RepID=A0ABW0GHB8_9MICO
MRVRVEVVLAPGVASVVAAELRVDVLDVTEHDAPARRVSRATLAEAALGNEPVTLDVEVALDPSRDHVVRAVADLAGTGGTDPGDLTTTTRVAVSADHPRARLVLHRATG